MESGVSISKNASDKQEVSSTDVADSVYFEQGDHENQVSEGGEIELQQKFIGCKKNSGHTEFIPVDTFTIDNLPKGHRTISLCKYIRATADLTVRVGVEKTSRHRPQFWPHTKKPYPLYEHRDKLIYRFGSGMICGPVVNFRDGCQQNGRNQMDNYKRCWCKKCKHSDTASHLWWEFYLDTSAHVVFDVIEASHTSLRFFYDREDSPVVIVDQVSVNFINVERDVCRLKCVTCDTDLGHKLEQYWKHFQYISTIIFQVYKKSRNVDKLCIIVSHPHGCSKMISIGYYVDKFKVGDQYLTKFTYTTCTCPGSSGATVHCMGYRDDDWSWWMYQVVHLGRLNPNLNVSGYGCTR